MSARFVINGKFFTQPVTGVQRYAREITAALDLVAPPGLFSLVMPETGGEAPAFSRITVVRYGRRTGALWEHIDLPRFIRKSGAIGVHLCNVAPLIRPGVVCMHDMGIREHPGFFSRSFVWWYRLLFLNAARRADAVLTVSRFSQGEIAKYYPMRQAFKIAVVPNAWQHFSRAAPDEEAPRRYGLEKDRYCFAMNSLSPNKNIAWVLRTAALHPEITFAVAGASNEKVFAEVAGEKVPKNVAFIGYITDGEAKALMRDSLAFLFPTLYEGFGLPPLEALSCGARVVASGLAVTREVLGDAALYVDPHVPGLPEGVFAPRNERAAEEALSRYSWERSARALLALLLQVKPR